MYWKTWGDKGISERRREIIWGKIIFNFLP